MKNVIVYGATSAIAQGAIGCYAKDGDRLRLVGRDPDKLKAVADDARARGASEVIEIVSDLNDLDSQAQVWTQARDGLDTVDVVIVAHGVLGDQERAQAEFKTAEEILRANFLSVVAILTPAANDLEEQGSGCITVIGSVAGDRGRQSNYVYGAAKGAVDVFLSGLRNRLFHSGVRVVNAKPGFVASPMTAHLEQGPLFAPASKVGRAIYRAGRSSSGNVYLPSFWWGIMAIIKSIPEPIFKRLKL